MENVPIFGLTTQNNNTMTQKYEIEAGLRDALEITQAIADNTYLTDLLTPTSTNTWEYTFAEDGEDDEEECEINEFVQAMGERGLEIELRFIEIED